MIDITPENVHTFPVGTTVKINYGAYFSIAEGRVIGHHITAATKLFPATASLIVRQEQDGEVTRVMVSQLYEIGTNIGPVGTYLIELAEAAPAKTKSPWSVA